jgi:hypothetical protein
METVPCEILPKMTDKERMIKRWNLQEMHQNWSPFDKATAIYFFIQKERMSYTDAAIMLGMDPSSVRNWVSIMNLSKQSQQISIERKIPFTYLSRIVEISKLYQEITSKPIHELEGILFEKIESRAMDDLKDCTNLARYLRISTDKARKLKFLSEPNFTVKMLLEATAEGKSIEIDSLMIKVSSLISKIEFLNRNDYSKLLKDNQIDKLQKLSGQINRFAG